MMTEHGSHGRLWLAMAVLLISMAVSAGCTTPPASPYDLAETNAITISADIRLAIDKSIKDANKIASTQDGKTYIDVDEFDRVLVFVPITEPELRQRHFCYMKTLPENALVKKWTDRFALAQQFSYRYSYVRILESTRHFSSPHFTAKVEVLIKATSHRAYGGMPTDIPSTPNDHMIWWPGRRSGFGGLRGMIDHLPAPTRPPGKIVTPSLAIDTISQSALDALRKSTPKTIKHTVIAHMSYDRSKKQWKLDSAMQKGDFPEPEWLEWSHGLVGKNADYVLKPDALRGHQDE